MYMPPSISNTFQHFRQKFGCSDRTFIIMMFLITIQLTEIKKGAPNIAIAIVIAFAVTMEIASSVTSTTVSANVRASILIRILWKC